MPTKKRNEIAQMYKWDIDSMYSSRDAWQADLEKAENLASNIENIKGHVADDAKKLLFALDMQTEMWRTLENSIVYAHMKRDEDNKNSDAQALDQLASSKASTLAAKTAFISPEIIAAGKERIFGFLESDNDLSQYGFMLSELFRNEEHVLSEQEENILAQISEVTSCPRDVFTMLNNADIDFGEVSDSHGNAFQMTHGNYTTFIRSTDRALRKNAYTKMHETYRAFENTIATNYNYSVKTDVVSARLRGYEDSRSAALFGDNVPATVYDSLVDTIGSYLPVLHRYVKLKKQMLGLKELAMYDVYAPLISIDVPAIPYETAIHMMNDALAPLGDEYLKAMNDGLSSGWVDVYENDGKTSGAYSYGSYDSKPFILLNYTDTLDDVFTIIHEMGHSMHSYFTRKTQPFIYGSHSIFTAEVASTVNENLLMKHLLVNETNKEKRIHLLSKHLEDFRTTVFRQTMFAEFEDAAHRQAESAGTLTSDWMCGFYDDLNKKYFGDAMSADDLIKYEWARIPHFYNAFYVYKYATGYSAACAISDMILSGDAGDYIEFLKTGDSDHPIELLKIAGVDMSTPEPVIEAMKVFEGLVDELEELAK